MCEREETVGDKEGKNPDFVLFRKKIICFERFIVGTAAARLPRTGPPIGRKGSGQGKGGNDTF